MKYILLLLLTCTGFAQNTHHNLEKWIRELEKIEVAADEEFYVAGTVFPAGPQQGTIYVLKIKKVAGVVRKLLYTEHCDDQGSYLFTTVYLKDEKPFIVIKNNCEVTVTQLPNGGSSRRTVYTEATFYISNWKKKRYEAVYTAPSPNTLDFTKAEIEVLLATLEHPHVAEPLPVNRGCTKPYVEPTGCRG